MDRSSVASFIARWQQSGAAERANYQLFLSELCDLLGVARPDPTKPDDADIRSRTSAAWLDGVQFMR